MSSKLIKVFVYGTLKRGEPNHHWLTCHEYGFSRFLDAGRTAKKFPLVVGTRYNIPFVLDKPDVGHNICGEIFEVDDAMFSKLDVLEDFPMFYDREVQDVVTATTNETLQCWLYLIRNFPENLLQKKHLEAYHNTSEQLYQERSERDSNVKAADDMDF